NCSLEGHQECLLAWVTDLEAQAKDVKCPVCKTPILLTERYDPAIQLSNFLNHKFMIWSPRILLGFIASGALVSSSVYGARVISSKLEKSWAARARARTIGVEAGSQAMQDVAPPPEPAPAMNILDLEIDIQIGDADDGAPENEGGVQRDRIADASGRSPINF